MPLPDALERGQLHFRINASDFPIMYRGNRVHGHPRLHGHAEQVGQVILALGVRVGQCTQPGGQVARRQTKNAGIHFRDFALFVCRVFFLDVANDLTRRVTHDAAVARRIIEMLGHQTDAVTSGLQEGF